MKGICFIPPLHLKTIFGTKNQTRRIIPEKEGYTLLIGKHLYSDMTVAHVYRKFDSDIKGKEILLCKPRYNVGEIIYIKEPYHINKSKDGLMYKYLQPKDVLDLDIKWMNKLFMPTKYARIFIKITAVRIERLQDISDKGCFREGIEETDSIAEDNYKPVYENGYNSTKKKNGTLIIQYDTPREAYADLIDRINGKGTWDSNPYVWVYDYNQPD